MARAPLRTRLAADPCGDLAAIAIEEGVSARAVVEALPAPMRAFADGGFFANAVAAIARWGVVTTVVHTDDGVATITGPIPRARGIRRPTTLAARLGVSGRLADDHCGGIAFVERGVGAEAEAFVVFFGTAGEMLMEVFIRHDATGALEPVQLAALRSLREAVVPDDDHDH